MRGIVFTAFLTFLDERRDFGVSNRVLNESEADLETSAFTSVNHYPSRDLKALLASATRILDEPFSEMVKEFGEFLFDHLMDRLSMHVVCSPESGPLFELVPASDMELNYGQEIEA